jgi:putative ABC transport system permease protein
MDSRLAGTFSTERLTAVLTICFAGLAVSLAAVGLYAVLANSVTARTVEIGIRMAVGAERGAVIRLILGQGSRMVGMGVGVGLAAAAVSARVLASQLYEVDPRDPWLYAAAAAVFGTVGIAASALPALRASRVDPLAALNAQ